VKGKKGSDFFYIWGCGVIGSTVVMTGQKKVKGKRIKDKGSRMLEVGGLRRIT